MTVELDLDHLHVIAECYVRLGRPAPPASNPDSPAFSDPGDSTDVECERVWVNGLLLEERMWTLMSELCPGWYRKLKRAAISQAMQSEV